MKTIAEKYKWKDTPSEITVETTRKLAAKHGMDGVIIIGWTDNGDGTVNYQTTTAGKKKQFAIYASELRDWLMSLLTLNNYNPILLEDRIEEHTD
jgi:hypothetical protein